MLALSSVCPRLQQLVKLLKIKLGRRHALEQPRDVLLRVPHAPHRTADLVAVERAAFIRVDQIERRPQLLLRRIKQRACGLVQALPYLYK